jgi:hypothetical protein
MKNRNRVRKYNTHYKFNCHKCHIYSNYTKKTRELEQNAEVLEQNIEHLKKQCLTLSEISIHQVFYSQGLRKKLNEANEYISKEVNEDKRLIAEVNEAIKKKELSSKEIKKVAKSISSIRDRETKKQLEEELHQTVKKMKRGDLFRFDTTGYQIGWFTFLGLVFALFTYVFFY